MCKRGAAGCGAAPAGVLDRQRELHRQDPSQDLAREPHGAGLLLRSRGALSRSLCTAASGGGCRAELNHEARGTRHARCVAAMLPQVRRQSVGAACQPREKWREHADHTGWRAREATIRAWAATRASVLCLQCFDPVRLCTVVSARQCVPEQLVPLECLRVDKLCTPPTNGDIAACS